MVVSVGSLQLSVTAPQVVPDAVAVVIPWNPKRQKNRSCLPLTWTADELGKRTAIKRFFGRVFSLCSSFRLQRPASWVASPTTTVAASVNATWVAMAAQPPTTPDAPT